MTSNMNTGDNGNETTSLVPPQLSPFLANIFNLKPIIGTPSREEVKLVHEAIRALNNFPNTSELRDTGLSTELSQYLFDIQMVCHRQKYPVNVLPNDMVYEPPALPNYIPIELKLVTGSPSNQEISTVHTALRISESFVNVPSIFDSDVHAELSQHLFDIQFARHVQRSIAKRSTPNVPAPHNQTVSHRESSEADANSNLGVRTSMGTAPQETIEPTETPQSTVEQSSAPNEVINGQDLNEGSDLCGVKELMVEIRDTLKNMNRVMIGSQNSLATGFNSSYRHDSGGYDPGSHSLINDFGEVPENHKLPTFKFVGDIYGRVNFSVGDLTENILARYLRFYSVGEEMVEEGEELKIKSGMVEDAKRLLSERLFLNRR